MEGREEAGDSGSAIMLHLGERWGTKRGFASLGVMGALSWGAFRGTEGGTNWGAAVGGGEFAVGQCGGSPFGERGDPV